MHVGVRPFDRPYDTPRRRAFMASASNRGGGGKTKSVALIAQP
jgi:hypothetical protein